MNEILNGNDLIVEADGWINKSSGRGAIRLLVINPDTFKKEIEFDWQVFFFPMESNEAIFERIFPWAIISIDDDFYEDIERERYVEEGHYDKETGKYIFIEEYYNDWKNIQKTFRPYENSTGEVDSYRLKLALNDLAMAFLKVDEYLENKFNSIIVD